MEARMERFLRSIGIDNVDSFDLSFDLCSRNVFNREQVDMVIVKQFPWDYHLLREFIDGLGRINYKYSLSFSYIKRPSVYDVLTLFDDWFMDQYRIHNPIAVSPGQGEAIKLVFNDEKEEKKYSSVVKDFSSFLSFIFYDFDIESSIKEPEPAEEGPTFGKREMKQINKAAESEAADAIVESSESSETPDATDSGDIQEMIRQDQEEVQSQVEDALLTEMRENAKRAKRDRENARRNKKGNYTPFALIDAIDENSGNVDFDGKVFAITTNTFGTRTKLELGVSDKGGGAIYVIMYYDSGKAEKIGEFKNGINVRVRGCSYIDEYSKNLTIKGHYVDLLPPDVVQPDKSEEKRVELHLHTKMSAMDSVNSMMDYCTYAKALGMKAIAITDHGVVQGFPEAQSAGKKTGMKILYGCEFYMVNDHPEYIKNPSDAVLNKSNYVVLDLETTGLSCRYDSIIEFGAVRIEHGTKVASLDILINPGYPLSKRISELTNITDDMLKGKPTILEAFPRILEFMKGSILVTHNADFDIPFLDEALIKCGMETIKNPVIDTLWLSRYVFPNAKRHNLGSLCRNMDVAYDEDVAHRADYDAGVTAEVWMALLSTLTKGNLGMKHEELANLPVSDEMLKHVHPFHAIVMAKNLTGLHDLYRLVSKSNIDYLAEVPKIPRREVEAVRSNMLVGSACFNGEVFDVARTKNHETLKRTIDFYDYIEVQPLSNYSFLVNMGDMTDDLVKKVITDIIETAEGEGKMVVATGDVHYKSPEEKKFRDVFILAKAVGGINHPLNPYGRAKVPHFENPDQHLRGTDEMLKEMEWLGKEKAYEITITNTNKIADMMDSFLPVPNDKLYKPFIPNVEKMLKDLCYGNAYELYGDPLPKPIEDRLEAELNGIITNGFSVIYYIAYRIVKKSNDDGFMVGSRGSVGSSFVATMANITEVNPLPPHYRCPKCKHLEWTKKDYPNVKTGYDLPEKACPVCGAPMVHDGQDIPFETFLGFNAEKVPDIDLNFPRDYQSKAHDYTKVLLGEENVFRAGTIETVAEKTAFGFARGYYERNGYNVDSVPKAKIAYLASGCVDVKRTTGQHPGGIVVIPSDHTVYDFTPIQYPAEEKNSTWKTTHFDFHSIHDTILKLDLLGHLDPMALKMMSDLTGVDVTTIPMNDRKVLSIFSSPEALNLQRNYLGEKTGALAIPEFGTEFVRGILVQTKPKTFGDLVIISGLSHGTDVWLGNADKLISNGITDIRGVIGCRDDIMTYLMDKGLSASVSFAIMEDVRHGKGVKPEFEMEMLAKKVPKYYIESCNKIKYMFPKGHATAYVMMAIRVGYFKIYYPLEFYATFFTVRSKQYDIATMVKGENAITVKLDELNFKDRSKTEKMSPKETEIRKTLLIAIEMVQRGMKFENIDLYRSDATKFVVDKEKNSLIPPFIVIDGLGEAAAQTVVDARANGEFTSIEDVQRRTTLNGTNIKDLKDLGVFNGLGESDQMSLFDFGL